ncbi:hypothetical protein BC939DRAFT_192190 [Gamsiella multidivaricata]|uniref:uncharacterized protein n=1 Tax=Gamsiella multidivaricata TaxID=101098 RepID=UPI00221FD629|nr:uncharacterized protein BC939DRAFT_192190 [Gamsiella multidivaricata]KAG0368265.1 hypothetical protein BGZ54_002312 [Gamsiella multidivaricata]KAI7822151.1 hypothetical protein BC939DRAFT_192190 [Gamsiella multidivaricata]
MSSSPSLFPVFAKAGSLHSLSSSSTSSFHSSSSSASSPLSSSRKLPFILLVASIAISSLWVPLADASSASPVALDTSTSSPVSLVSSTPDTHIQFQDSEEAYVPAVAELLPGVQLHKRAPPQPSPAVTTTDAASKPTKIKSPPTNTNSSGAPKPTMSSTATGTATPTPTALPDSKGDTALFGKPSVIAGYNLTTGILIYSAFMILFVAAIGSATWRRAKYRNQFRLQQQRNLEGGRVNGDKGSKKGGGDSELSDAALFKQASISKRALMKDVGPGGVLAANEVTRNKIAAANGAGRSFDDRSDYDQQSGQGVRFGEGTGNGRSTGRAGGMKKPNRDDINQGAYEMNSYGHLNGPLSSYQDNQDTTDYSRPPMTESADPYYSSGSSNSGYLDQIDDHHYSSAGGHNPQKPKPAHHRHQSQQDSISTAASSSPQPQYQQPTYVQRTNSSRMPQKELHDGNNNYRSNSGRRAGTTTSTRGLDNNNGQLSRIATQGILDRAGSGNSGTGSPLDGGMSRAGSNASSNRTRVAASPTQSHPTPIARSNSTRLPPSMRVGTPQLQLSSLSQQTNNHDYM